MLVDVAGRRVLDSSSLSTVAEVFSSSPESPEVLHAPLLATPISICDLLTEFPDVLSSDGFRWILFQKLQVLLPVWMVLKFFFQIGSPERILSGPMSAFDIQKTDIIPPFGMC